MLDCLICCQVTPSLEQEQGLEQAHVAKESSFASWGLQRGKKNILPWMSLILLLLLSFLPQGAWKWQPPVEAAHHSSIQSPESGWKSTVFVCWVLSIHTVKTDFFSFFMLSFSQERVESCIMNTLSISISLFVSVSFVSLSSDSPALSRTELCTHLVVKKPHSENAEAIPICL